MAAPKPLLIILAGPNGAGKSTFYEAYLAELSLPFLNADVFSRETGIDPYAAAREIAAIREHFVRLKRNFVFETVLPDPVGAKVAFAATRPKPVSMCNSFSLESSRQPCQNSEFGIEWRPGAMTCPLGNRTRATTGRSLTWSVLLHNSRW